MDKRTIYEIVDRLEPKLQDAARYIWQNPELGGTEEKSSAYYRKMIGDAGFEIHDIEDMPYAFYGECGSGKPVIAILGEYDALPGMSQKACASKEAVTEGAPGHGCGHNVLGAGAATAAIGIKQIMEQDGLQGTLRFYGCPEEELLIVGKVKMVAKHLFDDVDYVITWHPMCATQVWDGAALANVTARFYFTGISSHAGAAPEKGRSALDAVELMNVGVNYLREHVIDKVRIHYSVNCTTPPNVVHPKADSWYYIRAPHMSDVKDVLERVKKCALGAAMMTETEVEIVVEGGCCEIRENHAYADLVQENLEACPRPEYTEEELGFAEELQKTVDPGIVARDRAVFDSADSPMMPVVGGHDLYKIAPLTASTDGGDVSFVAPMHMFASACWPVGVAPHTWQAAAANGTTLAEKGALYASKVICGTVYDLLTKPSVAEAITKEFEATKDPDYAPMGY